ncbi:DNA (cytosine-5)-methyltransferase 1 [Alkalibacterium subtropicum]|uniref:Cytosine-specific methyltransferase n=1 Tax=Alkalibacterium subtropicum TaxID=753702 RepID=A0A1I1FKW2_9LACT|nr:DNA (cytosine-5-)-methyltransferase [Alkalibacterium subtropicum]SFC00129.1 DNA (cytosine-5)-methyltransferase 1 [Alkalibacterium subtropicum]
MLRVVETFSGIGSQVQALKNAGLNHSVVATVEWEIGALYAYDIIHGGPQNLEMYRHHTRDSIVEHLSQYNLSSDGKSEISIRGLKAMSMSQLKAILHSIERNNNLVDINTVTAANLPDTDVLTYSFPCQDLSVSGHWHNNTGGINRDANNRSTLIWQIERILIDLKESKKELPSFLLMENVNNILSHKHIDNFNEWQKFLESLGYVNQLYTLDSRNFGIPQSRVRTYLISVLAEDSDKKEKVNQFFFENNLQNVNLTEDKIAPISKFLRLDYSQEKYRNEAIESTPMYTPSRKKIYENNTILATDHQAYDGIFAKTVTTKQDRHPNSGLIEYDKVILTDKNKHYRNLTPRECFLLMGFDEEQYELLLTNNLNINKGRKILPPSKLIKLAGNSIVVPVLEEIFKQIDGINSRILNNH